MKTKEELLEQNILLAKFMGSIAWGKGDSSIFIPIHGIINIKTIELGKGRVTRYHKSWDWIMPVVEKIESYGYKVEIWQDSCDIFEKSQKIVGDCLVEPATESTKFQAVYVACVRFVEWYNKNQNHG